MFKVPKDGASRDSPPQGWGCGRAVPPFLRPEPPCPAGGGSACVPGGFVGRLGPIGDVSAQPAVGSGVEGQGTVFQGQFDRTIAQPGRQLAGNGDFQGLSQIVARNEQLPSLVHGIQEGADGSDQIIVPVPGALFCSGNGPLGLIEVVQPEVGSILGVHLLAGALGIRALKHLRFVPIPADQRVFRPDLHAAVGRLLAEYRSLQPGIEVEETVDDQPRVVFFRSQRFQRAAPSQNFLDFGSGEKPEDREVLASSPRDLAPETVDRRSLESAPFPSA